MTQGKLHILIGPVGAGKSTFAARKVARGRGLFLDVDTCMVRLYGGDARPAAGVMEWYVERRERCRALLWDTAVSALQCGADVYLELGLVTAREREAYYARADGEDLALSVILIDAPRDVRRERVAARNVAGRAYTQVVPTEFFERASDVWEQPTAAERKERAIVEV